MPPRSRVLLLSLVVVLPFILDTSPRAAAPVQAVRQVDPALLRFEAGEEGTLVRWGALPSEGTPGRPDLPVDRFVIEAPEGMQLVEVRARAVDPAIARLDAPPAPYRGTRPEPAGPMPGTPSMGETYPEALVEHEGSWMRGRRLETVAVHPLRYRPGDGTVEIARRVELEFLYGPAEEPVRPRRVAWPDGDRFGRALDRLLADSPVPPATPHHDDIEHALINGSEPFSPRFRPSEEGSPVRYLIVTRENLASPFQRLADWKTALGVPAVVRTLEWIEANYPSGADQAEDVRIFLREAVEAWGVEYLLVGGDVDVVPIRLGRSYYFGGEEIPTDMYYACLDGSWNGDGDAIFGEAYVNPTYPGDGADLYPELWVARAPVRDSVEVVEFIDKQLDYATLSPLGPGFGETNLMLGEVFFPQNWLPGYPIQFDAAELCESAYARLNPGATAYRMYENHTAYPGSVPEVKNDVVAEINSGYNVVVHAGHGFRNTMAVGVGGESLTNGDADQFFNGVRQGLLYAINCTSSALDFDCIAEHFMRNPFGGVLASVGSTRLDFPATGWDYQNEFFDQLHQQGVTKLGEAATLQKLPYVPNSSSDGEHRWTQFSLITLGDPDLDIHTGPVDALNVSVAEPFELGTDLYTATVTNSGGPVEGAVVCLHKDGDAYGTALTDASGTALVPFDPDTPGMASLGVRAHDHRSRVDSVAVGSPAGPHLFVSDLTVDDAAGGDGDGQLEAGETAFLYPHVDNRGLSTAAGVTATLSGAPAGITILDGAAACPDVTPGGSVLVSDPFEILVDPSLVDLAGLSTLVDLQATAYSRQEGLILYAGSPQLDLTAAVRRDTTGNGNGDGILQAGEDQHLRFHLGNTGLGRSSGLTAVLSSGDPAVTILDGTSSYGDLEAGASSGGDGFLFRFSDTALTHPFRLQVSDHRGTVLDRTVSLEAPGVPGGVIAVGAADNIALKWSPVAAGDLRGYNVYRAPDPGGPYARVNTTISGRTSYYRDEHLPPLTRYYYKVAAVDSSGNESVLSGIGEATTSLPLEEGFPLQLGAATASSPTIAYLDGDTKAEIVTGGEEIYAVTSDGKEVVDGDQDAQTLGVFSQTGFGPFWSPPSVGDMDGDGVPEIAAAGWSSGKLYVWNSRGEVRSGWPRNVNIGESITPAIWSAPVMGDVDNDGQMELFINAVDNTFGFRLDGSEIVDGDNDPATHGVFLKMAASANYSSPALADVDNDGFAEVIVGSRDGNLYVMNGDGTMVPNFPYAVGGEITNSPSIGDLNNDGWKEIVFGSSNFQYYAVDVNLNSPTGWPAAANMNQDYDASAALGDLNGNGFLDVVICAGNGTVYAYYGHTGWLHAGWPIDVLDAQGTKVPISSSPALGNLDGDPDLEICFGANDGNLYAFNLDTTPVDGFPIGTANDIQGGPVLWDVDEDGLTEVVAHSLDEKVYVWDSPGVFDPNKQPWPMFAQNGRRTGEVNSQVWIPVAVPGDGTAPVRPGLSPAAPNPFAARTVIGFRVPEAGGADTPVRLDVFDVNGRLVRTLVREPRPAGHHETAWDGRGDDGRRLGGGIYFYRLRAGGNSWTRKMVLLP